MPDCSCMLQTIDVNAFNATWQPHLHRDMAAVSTGAVLMTAGTKGKRSRITALTHHDPSTDGWSPLGQASDIEITAREITVLKKELYQIIADHSGNPIKKVEKDSDRRLTG